MGKGLFITATGTDIGKTYVTALLAKHLRDNGYDCGYYKAALSGAVETEKGLIPGDALLVKETAGLSDNLDSMVSYVYKNAYSPHLAAQLEGNPLEMAVVKSDYQKACKKHDFVLMEGSGGIVCPIRYDEKCKIFLEDIIKALSLPTIIVADAGLGTINSVVLTVEYMKNRNIPVKGIILNNYNPNSEIHNDNVKMVQKITKIPVLSLVKNGDNDIDIDTKLFTSFFI